LPSHFWILRAGFFFLKGKDYFSARQTVALRRRAADIIFSTSEVRIVFYCSAGWTTLEPFLRGKMSIFTYQI